MEVKFTEQQSMEVISEMIDRARNNVQKGSANSMIFWGFVIAFIAILNIILMHTLNSPYQSYWVWTLTIPCIAISYFNKRKIDRTAIVRTHIDKIVTSAWVAFGISNFIFIFLIFWMAYGWKNYQLFMLITPVIMLMVALAQFVTAKACRFRPFLYGALVMWLGAVCCVLSYFLLKRTDIQFAILAIGMIMSFVIPGYQLNSKAKDHV